MSSFWKDKPIVKKDQITPLVNIIDENISNKYPKQNAMFEPYIWTDIDISKDTDCQMVCDFLNKYYKVFRTNNKFGFNYTMDYLRWSLGKNIVIGMQTNVENGSKLGGLICGSIRKYQVFNKELDIGQCNYLCVHPKLHHKNVGTLLINELTRVFISNNITVGSFASQREVGRPICKIEYYHRPLNYTKLHDNGFVSFEGNNDIQDLFTIHYKHRYQVERLEPKYYDEVYKLFTTYHDRYNFYEKYTLDEFIRVFTNKIMHTYVLIENNNIIDFFSYYQLPYKVSDKDGDILINAVYLYTYTIHNTTQLTIFKSALLCAQEDKFDIFTAPDTMENMDVLFDNFSKFDKSDNALYHNFFNLTCPDIKPEQMSVCVLR